MKETRESIKEKAELIIWECREREKYQTKKECLWLATNCIAYAKEILKNV